MLMSRPVKIVQGAPRALVTEAAIGPAPAGAWGLLARKVELGFAVASRPKPARAPSTASLLHLSLAREPSAPPSVGPRRINDRRKKLNHQHLRQLVLIAQLELVLARRNLKTPWPTSAHSSRPARPRTGSAGTAVLVEVGARLGRPNSYSTRRRGPPSAARPLGPRRSRNSRRRRTRGPPCCRSAGAGPTSSFSCRVSYVGVGRVFWAAPARAGRGLAPLGTGSRPPACPSAGVARLPRGPTTGARSLFCTRQFGQKSGASLPTYSRLNARGDNSATQESSALARTTAWPCRLLTLPPRYKVHPIPYPSLPRVRTHDKRPPCAARCKLHVVYVHSTCLAQLSYSSPRGRPPQPSECLHLWCSAKSSSRRPSCRHRCELPPPTTPPLRKSKNRL